MSEIAIATARIVVRPDTTLFTQQLLEEVNRSISRAQAQVRPIQVQAALGGFTTAALSQTAALAATQEAATASTLGLASAAQVENSAFGQQATILKAATLATEQKAGADARAAASSRAHASQIGQVQKAAFASTAGMLGLRGAVLTAGTAFLGATVAFQAFGQAVSSAADFEQNLNVFQATAGATADEMERVSEAARQLGRDITLPGVAAIDATDAMLQLARAGLSVEQSIAGARGALQLATAAQIDNATAANLIAGNLNAFGLAGEDAVKVADLLAGAANESQVSLEDMGIGLRQVAGAANLLGLTVDETVALLTQLTRAGLAGSDAGTTLRVALVKLANPDVRKEVEALVGSLTDLDGTLNPEKLVQFGEEITKSGDTLDQTGRLYELFGENSLRVIGLLAQEGVPGFRELSEATSESGLAAEVAGARMEGLRGDIEVLKNELAAMGLTIGQVVSPALGGLARGAAQFISPFNDAADATRRLVTGASDAGPSFNDLNNALRDAQTNLEFYREKGFASAELTENLKQEVEDAAGAFGRFGISVDDAKDGLTGFDVIVGGVTTAIRGLVGELERLSPTAPVEAADAGLNINQILNRVAGFDAAEVRARISGDTGELLAVLEAEQAFLEQQLDRQFVKNRPELRRKLEQALLGVTNDIAAITKSGAAEAERAARDAASAQRQADEALLDLLGNRREDVERRIAQAATTEGFADDIRFQNRLQALIKQQIAKVRAQVQDEKLRAQAVRELRIALIASRQEEEALRAERAQQQAANRQESAQLDVDLAEITGNVSREIAARQRLIALLKKQQADVKKGTTEWKRLRNEIARQQQAIEDARDQAQGDADDGRRAQEFFFEQLQAQQGFAANLLGNLITGPTAGLVGVPSPTTGALQVNLGASLGAAAGLAEGKSKTAPTAGQAQTTNELLSAILGQLKVLNQTTDAPEAINNKKQGASYMDGIGGGSGAAAVM